MAPGPYGCYNGSLCGEFNVDVMRMKEFYQERRLDGKQRYGRDLQFGRQRDGKKGESVEGGKPYGISPFNLNGKNEKVQVDLVAKRFGYLEPGELCSQDTSGVEDEFKGSGDMDEASSGRKRKFRHIEHDEGKKINDCRKENRNKVRPQMPLQSHSSLTIKFLDCTSTKNVRKSEDLSTHQSISANFIQDSWLENSDEPEQMTNDCITVRSISFSRWAAANGSFQDDDGQRAEHGELVFREGSVRSASNTSGSGGSCQEDCFDPMKDGIDDMDVYGEGSDVEDSHDSLKEDCKDNTLDYAEFPCRSINMLQACRSVDDFDKLNMINEGAYGTVYRARDKKTGEIVALKKVKMQKEREGFPLTSLREINILLSLHHPSIVELKEVVVGRDLDDIFIVMEYMEHDLKGLLGTMKKPFHLSEVKCLMLQLLAGVKHLHDNWVLHRDLKTSNLLFNNRGELKICDFGLSRQYGSPLKPYTKLVVTLWYRAPELLLGVNEYSTAIDMWSVGCMMAELLNKEPLFPGKSELDQLFKIFRILGTPDENIWPGLTRLPGAKAGFVKKPFKLHEKFPRKSPTSFLGQPVLSDAGFNLLNKLLTYDPEKRITAEDALDHPWFRESPLPMCKDFMPIFPTQYRKGRHQQRFTKSPYPLEQPTQKDSQYLCTSNSLDSRK